MPWFVGDLPPYMPCVRKSRQVPFARVYPVEMWAYQSLLKDYGEGVREWVPQAVQEGRQLAMHFFIPGTKMERLLDTQRDLWYKAWRQVARYIQFSIYPEFDAWFGSPLLEGRRLQWRSIELAKDMHAAGVPMVWLLLELEAGGMDDIKFYSGYANDNNMRWVATNMQGARDMREFKAALENLARYQTALRPDIGVIVNGPSSEARIRAVKRLFEGREVVISNASRVEMARRGFV